MYFSFNLNLTVYPEFGPKEMLSLGALPNRHCDSLL